ncbi:MAG TPA: zinc ribbon domain-containing protein [Burkholderiales bacterium]|nr:zinc ribbon domain-containing protein [Burkholderiales bacterium]
MPIYEYRCADCGFEEEYLQKVSEPPLTVCPKCGKPSFRKKLSAAGFQLKGSGWYATDFRGGSKPEANKEAKPESKAEAKSEAGSESKAAAKKPDAPASGGTTTS